MTAEEREASLDRVCEQDEPPGEEEDEEFEPVHGGGAGRDPPGRR